MRYEQDLQVKLRERQRAILTAPTQTAAYEIRMVTAWIENQPLLRSILAEAHNEEPDLDVDEWLNRAFSIRGLIQDPWPSRTSGGRAVLIWKLMQTMSQPASDAEPIKLVWSVSGTPNGEWREVAQFMLAPLFDYLTEQVGDQGSVLYTLARYVRRLEWFDQQDLHRRFEQAKAESKVGEEVYNTDLQRFLFLDGGYEVYAKARSASGEADLVGNLSTNDPLVMEGKLFDAGSHGRTYLADGFNQIYTYAKDHQKPCGYLVIFNNTKRLLELPHDGPADAWPPYIQAGGVRIYFVVLRALPDGHTASKRGRADPYTITREEFFPSNTATD